MKKILIIILIFILILTLTGCSSNNTADILWEDISITVNDIYKVPEEIGFTGSSYTTDTHLIEFEVNGEPSDHFYTERIVTLMEIYDENSERCSLRSPIIGTRIDILMENNIPVVIPIYCPTRDSKLITIIFRDSAIDGLDDISAKFNIDVKMSDMPEEYGKIIIEKRKQTADLYKTLGVEL